MGWAQFRDDGTTFLVRVGGVAVADGRVLLHRTPHEEFWSLPGGRLQVGETAAEGLHREMLEEIGADVEVGDLLWVVENFFEHTPLDRVTHDPGHMSHHEVGLYLAMSLPDAFTGRDAWTGVELEGTPDEFELEFRWFPQSEVAAMDVRPAVIKSGLAGDLPPGVRSVVNRE